jgi:hypothetical protein
VPSGTGKPAKEDNMSEETERQDGTEIPEDAELPAGIQALIMGVMPEPWAEGQPLPHTAQDFSDPPGGAAPEDWKRFLVGVAREADSADDLAALLLTWVGVDLVRVHGVPPDVAEAGVTKWAEWLFAEFHDTADPDAARTE